MATMISHGKAKRSRASAEKEALRCCGHGRGAVDNMKCTISRGAKPLCVKPGR